MVDETRMIVDGYEVIIRHNPRCGISLIVNGGSWLRSASLATIGAFISATAAQYGSVLKASDR